MVGVSTSQGEFHAPVVVNAAGPWGAELAAMAHVGIPVEPRRGFVMVTEPVPPTVFHKVYAAEYVGDVGSGDAAMQSSPVVESTASGTILIGSTRERVGFDPRMSVEALRLMAGSALALFPSLAGVSVIRSYWGFRPYCSDHLPIIGPDPRAPGLWHACGHEGAGIGLAPGTGKLLSQLLTGAPPGIDPAPFRPERFEDAA
ncbi:MAG: FAD-binding oxidoreductase [Acidipropionibacterium sp.]|nr:FAD-binding oxidoreductase [Acidipropionibacterium sp.]